MSNLLRGISIIRWYVGYVDFDIRAFFHDDDVELILIDPEMLELYIIYTYLSIYLSTTTFRANISSLQFMKETYFRTRNVTYPLDHSSINESHREKLLYRTSKTRNEEVDWLNACTCIRSHTERKQAIGTKRLFQQV